MSSKVEKEGDGFQEVSRDMEEMGEIIKKVKKLGSSQERHFVSVSLPARTRVPIHLHCPDPPRLTVRSD